MSQKMVQPAIVIDDSELFVNAFNDIIQKAIYQFQV